MDEIGVFIRDCSQLVCPLCPENTATKTVYIPEKSTDQRPNIMACRSDLWPPQLQKRKRLLFINHTVYGNM